MAGKTYPGPPSDRRAAVHQRDAALLRVVRVRRATIIGAGALTAGLAALVSALAPGRTLGAKLKVHSAATTARVAPRASSVKPRMPPLARPGQLGLQAPGSAPQASSPPASAPQAAPAPAQPAPSQAAPSQAAAPQPSAGPAVSGGS